MTDENSINLSFVVKDKRATAGGHGRRGRRTPEYRSWRKMHDRCYRETQNHYEIYGGRGIKICERWRGKFINFLHDMGPKPSQNHSIDRIDGDANYSCGHCDECTRNHWTANCRWATPQEQMDNSKRSVMLTCNGMTMSIRGWAKHLGVTHAGIRYRMTKGWTIDEIVKHFSH